MSGLRDQLQAIYDQRGQLTPALVVDEARDKNHPLHSRFEWNDKIAGEAWRREQAAALIRSVSIVYKETSSGPARVRAFTAIKPDDAHAHNYEPVEEVLADPVKRQIVLNAMNREWRVFKRRYEHLAEFASLIDDEARQRQDGAA